MTHRRERIGKARSREAQHGQRRGHQHASPFLAFTDLPVPLRSELAELWERANAPLHSSGLSLPVFWPAPEQHALPRTAGTAPVFVLQVGGQHSAVAEVAWRAVCEAMLECCAAHGVTAVARPPIWFR